MSTDSRPLENSRFQPEADSIFDGEPQLGDGARRIPARRGRSTSAAMWSSYWKRGTASSGCSSRKARAMRPDFCASNSGSRPPWMRLWTKAEMNTVLPARDRPVTPSRSAGENRLAARSASVSKAISASSVKVVRDANRKRSSAAQPFRYRDAAPVPEEHRPGAGWAQRSAGVRNASRWPAPGAALADPAVEADHCQTRRREAADDARRGHRPRRCRRVRLPDLRSSGCGRRRAARQACRRAADQAEIAVRILGIEAVQEDGAAAVDAGMAAEALEGLAGAAGGGAKHACRRRSRRRQQQHPSPRHRPCRRHRAGGRNRAFPAPARRLWRVSADRAWPMGNPRRREGEEIARSRFRGALRRVQPALRPIRRPLRRMIPVPQTEAYEGGGEAAKIRANKSVNSGVE